jgi:AraC-like DNA-binding protein
MDVLSEVLKAVKLDGAIFYNAEFSSPWCSRSPASSVVAPYLSRESRHVIMYHLMTEGRGYAYVEGDDRRITVEAGNIVIFPHGDPHVLGNGPPVKPVDNELELQRIMSHGLMPARSGGGGELTKYICGYMICDPQLSQMFLGGLPKIFTVNIRNDAAGQWLENSIRYSVGSASASMPGGEAVLAKLSEVLFVETLRRYMNLLPPEQKGWLAGARDPEVGKALALLHRKPAHPWTIAALATEAGTSRSVLAERFRRYLSETPIAYLTRWRLQLGAQMLKSSRSSVAQIAAEVGYESEPAFNRAFKREFGLPPARFRAHAKSASGKVISLASVQNRRNVKRGTKRFAAH